MQINYFQLWERLINPDSYRGRSGNTLLFNFPGGWMGRCVFKKAV
ncbi:hypothetical protein ADIS_2126 [Lunatimonas lonarensis]|uniref:Uncharacterized protein n=1 Tax=Lunatimonas lonarensis TaxID=1232681 RepID=R7ZTM7_9BACT|nr:hypothetical protein ADIS_2126 [Lunatimonas lonarensis]